MDYRVPPPPIACSESVSPQSCERIFSGKWNYWPADLPNCFSEFGDFKNNKNTTTANSNLYSFSYSVGTGPTSLASSATVSGPIGPGTTTTT